MAALHTSGVAAASAFRKALCSFIYVVVSVFELPAQCGCVLQHMPRPCTPASTAQRGHKTSRASRAQKLVYI